MNEFDRLLELVKSQGHDIWIGGPAADSSVTELENAIGASIPDSLSRFLTTYGTLAINDCYLSGIIDNRALHEKVGSIYGDTILLRDASDAPPQLWAVYPHADGAYCMDISRPTGNGEYGIVNYEHGTIQHDKTLADSYDDFVCQWFLKGWTTEPA